MSDDIKKIEESFLTLDNKDYKESDLNEKQMALLNIAKYLEPQVQELNTKLAVLQDHKTRIINELKTSLESGIEEATIIETKEIKNESS